MNAIELAEGLARTVGRARALDLRPYERQPAPTALEWLVPQVAAVLSDGAAVFEQVLEHCESRLDGAEWTSVSDLSFMGRMELLGQRRRLSDLAPTMNACLVLTECGSSRRSLLRAGAAVEQALRERAGLPTSTPDDGPELQTSLQVRAAYARLRRDLSSLDEPSSLSEVAARLIEAATCLDEFTRSPLFDDVRFTDRHQLQRLHERNLSWLGNPGRHADDGLRLWQDLSGCAALLSQINLRVELLEHDQRVVQDATRAIARPRPPLCVPDALWERLHGLYGRDDGVDGLLDSGAGMLAVEWQEPLGRLRSALGLSAAGA